MNPTLLVMAKAPLPGQVKTRLGGDLADRFDIAADLAAAALLDTLDAANATSRFGTRRLALAGDLGQATRSAEITAALAGWEIVGQRGHDLAGRLAHAHLDVSGPVIQVGMDTPQVEAPLLDHLATRLEAVDAVLGPAVDGGWWVLGLREAQHGRLLRDVVMSRADTGTATRRELARTGLTVEDAPVMRDVDYLDDALEVAHTSPHTRFAAAIRSWDLARRVA